MVCSQSSSNGAMPWTEHTHTTSCSTHGVVSLRSSDLQPLFPGELLPCLSKAGASASVKGFTSTAGEAPSLRALLSICRLSPGTLHPLTLMALPRRTAQPHSPSRPDLSSKWQNDFPKNTVNTKVIWEGPEICTSGLTCHLSPTTSLPTPMPPNLMA